MTSRDAVAPGTVAVTVELFGSARIRAGLSVVSLQIGTESTAADLGRELSRACPALLGDVLLDGGGIADGYALNRNGLAFLSADDDAPLGLQSGDALLLLSNQAGG